MTRIPLPTLFVAAAMTALAACGGPTPDAVPDRAPDAAPGATAPAESGVASQPSQAMSPEQNLSPSGYDLTPIERTEEEWKEILSPDEYRVARQDGTERAFTGRYWDNKKDGVYLCIGCGLPLYKAATKFESGTGWPSFWEPFDPTHVREKTDTSLGMVRTEIECVRCGSHLGHVFNNGPEPTGMRHCTNSVSLRFVPEGEPLPEDARPGGGGDGK